MSPSQKHIEDLTAALLAVNNYSIQRVWDQLADLRAAGLLDPRSVVARDRETLSRLLADAGYDRGRINVIVADRLLSLHQMVLAGELNRLEEAVRQRDRSRAEALLLAVPGVGPRVVDTAWMLLTSDVNE